ncbi:MAG: HEAT repeat domain-containing protein [Bacteroidota bacterium]|nr:HEAT repeat domain-containing protein [Bacteroidota bacterium]MDP4211093.1 HEAT repeat domain-containing protein [Bacteroidota bacterium]MDP4249172.1 HEAT repeat domain-containing protein [Bacteroidota bacterium]
MKSKLWRFGISILCLSAWSCNPSEKNIPEEPATRPASIVSNPSGEYLSPEESMKKMYLPKGYHLELVASEPLIQEPVSICWDGDGRMYVAEMLSYMQDVDGSNENLPMSRIVRMEDTNGDGKYDKSTVFIDSLVLPRMMMTLNDQLVINDTYTYDLWSYRDTNGDGKADEKKLMYQSDAKDTRNLEHQRSGLIWNIDNYIYLSRDPVRYRYLNNRLVADSFPESPGGQWGLGKDDYGRLYFSTAGGETPALDFQQNPVYGTLDPDDQRPDNFDAVWPITGTPDVQGGSMRVRSDSTLNHFTACNGQSIFRGDRLPQNLKGDLFICEPVGRLIRRAKVIDRAGEIILKNAYDSAEFLASTDMNFRPVNSITGPDGCLYIVDMYHGIIQESAWTKPDSYLRPRIQRMGLDKNIGRGRIYRLVHDDYTPGPLPHMMEDSSSKLVSYLDHPNGWWRDEAQKLIILRGDRSVVPALKEMAVEHQSFWDKLLFWKKAVSPLGRIHALWTLNGLQALDKDILFQAYQDEDPQVRKTAVWISDPYLKRDDSEVLEKLEPLMKDTSADVRFQLSLSLRFGKSPKAQSMLKDLLASNVNNEIITASWKRNEEFKIESSLETKIAGMSEKDKDIIRDGREIFSQLCSTCHGPEGKGMSSMVAPPLAGQPRINGDPNTLIKILLHGLSGPVDGKNYPDVMPALGANDNRWIASVLSYIRNDMDNKAPLIDTSMVKRVRNETAAKKGSWTLAELEK